MVQAGGAPGGRGGLSRGPRSDSFPLRPPGGSFRSVPSLGDLMLTYGVSYYPDSDDSHAPGSSLDLSPELPIGALGCFLTTFSGISQGRLQLHMTSHPPPILLPPLLLVLLLNKGYHPQPNPSPAPLVLTPEQFQSHSLSSVSLPHHPGPCAFLSHLDGVGSLSPRIRPSWPLASSSGPL